MRKTIILLTVLIISVFTFSGCTGSKSATGSANEDIVDGGWEIACEECDLPGHIGDVYKKFEGKEGENLMPVAYIGSQQVAGRNYVFISFDRVHKELRLLSLYEDLEGNVSVGGIEDFNLTTMTSIPNESTEKEKVAGGWELPKEYTETPLPETIQKAFDKATVTMIDSKITPMALLATQIVAGMNYAVLCHTVDENGDSIQIITIYEDVDGNSVITNTYTIFPKTIEN